MPAYAALLLDFYGTLVDEDDAIVARIAAQVASASPRRPSPREVSHVWSTSFAALCADAHGASFRTQRDVELASLGALLARFECALDPVALSQELFAYWARPSPRPGAERFLAEIDLPICLVSNIDRADLDAALASLGWSFERVITSEACRAYKPRPEMFRAALSALGRRVDEVLHVGDSIGSDLRGAGAAGIAAAWLNPNGRALPDGVAEPRHVAKTLADLQRWLRSPDS